MDCPSHCHPPVTTVAAVSDVKTKRIKRVNRLNFESGNKGDRTLFLKKFLTQGTKIASVAPSSRWLSRETCRYIDPTKPQTIVELGAGTGPVTAYAAARMHPESRLIALEYDKDLAEAARRRVPNAHIIQGDIADMHTLVEADKVDVVLSCLPTPTLPDHTVAAMLKWIEDVAAEAHFAQITEIAWVFQRYYRKMWDNVKFQFVARNIPPSGVYHCSGLRSDWRTSLKLTPPDEA